MWIFNLYFLKTYTTSQNALDKCKEVYGKNAIIFSNSAGSYKDPGYTKAIELEKIFGLPILRHNTKKPDGIEFIVKYFNCPANELAIIGDRFFTDVLFGNLNGMLTICTNPLVPEDSWSMRKMIDLEYSYANSLMKQKLKAPNHPLYSTSFVTSHHKINEN